MPGVGDQVRRTQLKLEQKQRKKEMEELILLVREGRLYEADERQLETLKLVRDLQQAFDAPAPNVSVTVDEKKIIKAVKRAMKEVVAKIPAPEGISPAADPARPGMRHTSLADLVQGGDEVEIEHGDGLGEEETGTEDSAAKLEKLRKLKGS